MKKRFNIQKNEHKQTQLKVYFHAHTLHLVTSFTFKF